MTRPIRYTRTVVPRESNESGLLAKALSPLARLSAGVFCNQLSAFLKEVATVGGAAAVAGLTGPYAWTVLAVAGLFGVTEAWQSAKEKKKARHLADQLDRLAKSQSNALELLHKIADGEIGVTLDLLTQEDLKDRIVAGLASAGLATSEQVDRLHRELREDHAEQRDYHTTADLLLREIQDGLAALPARLGDRLPELPPPNNNFVEADVTPNRDFVGRVRILANLHKRLEAGSVAITHAVSGEGGIGKTQVAIRYALDHGG